MKKFFSIFGICVTLLFLSCLSVDYSQAEYYSIEEVMDTWEESIYDNDLDQQMSVYWPDAYARLHFQEDREQAECFNREEIRNLMEQIKGDDFDLGDFEFPPYAILTEIEDEMVSVIYYYEGMKKEENLLLTRRDDRWGIQEHYFHHFEAEPVSSLSMWADENRSGHIEPWEGMMLTSAVHVLLFGPHRVESGLDEIFDMDRTSFIEEEEVMLARHYFAFFVLPRMAETTEWLGPELLDLDRNDRVEPFEIDSVAEYLVTWESNRIPDRPDDDPLLRFLDENGDGHLEEHEASFLFWHLTGALIRYPHPDNPLEVFSREREDDGSVQPPASLVLRDDRRTENALESIRGKRVAVVDISSETDKINEETRKGLVFFVENSFVNTGMVKVVDRKSIEKIYEENRFQASGLTDEETAVEIGKLVGAEIIVTGSVTAVGSNFYLQLRMIDVKTAEVVASSLGEAKIENEFLNMSSMAVERLF